MKLKRYDYNVIVIGAGSAGLVAALVAAATQAKVALVEKDKMGGDCLNTGCVPSKALIKAARAAYDIRQAQRFGINSGEVEVDFEAVMAHVHASITAIEPHDSVARFTELGVDCFQASAFIEDPHHVRIGDASFSCRSIIIATGAKAFIPDLPGIHDIDYLCSDNLWQLKTQPKRLLVVGGGPIGVELAQAFQRLGSNVTLADSHSRLLKIEDEDVSSALQQQFISEGMDLRLQHRLTALQSSTTSQGAGVAHFEHQGENITIGFDRVLIALGRQANIEGFGLQELNIEFTKGQTVKANPFLQTNIANIYVCGDVTGPYQFTHAASHQAWYATINALLSPLKKFRVDYSNMAWCTFVDPQIARLGINEQEARAKNIAYESVIYRLEDLDRAICEGKNIGFVKVLTKPNSDKILGVTIMADNAGELISEFILAKTHGLGLNKILSTLHIYPTWSEANKAVAGQWRRQHTPAWALKVLALLHRWRRNL